jgi:hypothetical protein
MSTIPDPEEGLPVNPLDIEVTIRVPEHMGPGEVSDVLEKVARVTNALAGRMLLGGAFQGAGAAHPVAQQIIQCAAAAAAAAANLNEQRKQVFVPGGITPRGGRA